MHNLKLNDQMVRIGGRCDKEPARDVFTLFGVFFIAMTMYTAVCFGDFTLSAGCRLLILAVLLCCFVSSVKTSVLTLQVCLSDRDERSRELQMDLNRIAKSKFTSTNKGLSNVLKETAVALFQHHDSYISAYSSMASLTGTQAANNYLDYLSIEERMIKRPATELQKEQTMVTILVAASGQHKLPAINNSEDLKKASQILLEIGCSDLVTAVEVMWTPQFSSTPHQLKTLVDHLFLKCFSFEE